MIGFLRFLGLINAAVWLGIAVFFVFGAEPAVGSRKMADLIGTNNFPFFSVAIGQVLWTSFFHLYCVCAAVAVLHLGAEWLYLGKYPARVWLGLVAVLCFLGLAQGMVLQPIVRDCHNRQFRTRAPVEEREAAARSFKRWRMVSKGLNYLVVAGLGLYLWRVGNPEDPMRFVSARQFRS